MREATIVEPSALDEAADKLQGDQDGGDDAMEPVNE